MAMRGLRGKDHYKAITRELRCAGLQWREEKRGRHAALLIHVNGREETEILALTPSDSRAAKNAVSHVRRRIRKWKAEAAMGMGAIAATLLTAASQN